MCPYCMDPIAPGTRVKFLIRADGRVAQYHRPCYRKRRSEMADGAAEESKYGKITSSEKVFHPGEPVFLLRATDPLASQAIIDYARRCEREGAPPDHVDACFDASMRMSDWQRSNPDLVKPLPD